MATAKKASVKKAPRPKAEVRDDAPRYRVDATSFIDNRLVQAGGEVTYWGVPGKFLYPLNESAKTNKRAARDVIKDPGYEDESAEQASVRKSEELRELDNELQGVDAHEDAWEDEDEDQDDTDVRVHSAVNTKPLPEGERAELEQHVVAMVEATKEAEEDDTNRVTVKLQGQNEETKASLQGATPVLDKGSKK